MGTSWPHPVNILNPELQAALFFLPEEDIASVTPFGAGNINDTFILTIRSGEKRILQRLNPDVFPDPHAVMQNMQTVLEHLRREISRDGAWKDFIPLSLFPGKSGDWLEAEDGSVWRLTNLVADSRSHRSISLPGQAEQLGRGLGLFHRMLRTLDSGKLHDTLPDIHNTAGYLRKYDTTAASRKPAVHPEARICDDFIRQRRTIVNLLEADGEKLSRGVIHGDPKVDNFLFDRTGKKVVSLIDLDTVKPGLLLHDIGDAIRSCCNSSGESPREPEKVFFDPDIFHAWLSGYLAEGGFLLNACDRSHIVDSALVIAFELGLRFYRDYLDGNRYFKISSPDENLYRSLVQFRLVRSMEKQSEHLHSLVRDIGHARQR